MSRYGCQGSEDCSSQGQIQEETALRLAILVHSPLSYPFPNGCWHFLSVVFTIALIAEDAAIIMPLSLL